MKVVNSGIFWQECEGLVLPMGQPHQHFLQESVKSDPHRRTSLRPTQLGLNLVHLITFA